MPVWRQKDSPAPRTPFPIARGHRALVSSLCSCRNTPNDDDAYTTLILLNVLCILRELTICVKQRKKMLLKIII